MVQNISFAIRKGDSTSGLDMNRGTVGCMKEMGITECLRVKEQVLLSATEAAEMILRVDKVVYCAPRQREKTGCHN